MRAAPQKEPVFAIVYGPSSYGKTVDAGYAFPNALFVCKTGGTKSIVSQCGYQPATLAHTTLDDAAKVLQQHAKSYDAVVVDEFDFLVEDTMNALGRRFTGFKLFGELRKSVMNFRNVARDCGVHVLLTALERGPKVRDDGVKVRGGPALTGDLPEKLPAMCDLVLRAARGEAGGIRPWPGVYRLDSNSQDWVGKDRDGGTPDPSPMNIGEILRLNGYTVSRMASAPWQEALVERLTENLMPLDDAAIREMASQQFLTLAQKVPPALAKWTVRDAIDRTILYKAKSARAASFYADTPLI
jgi:hypothetical protein